MNDIPERCREPCDDAVELANNAQCLSNFACLCNGDDDEVDDIGECFSCVVRHTADEQRRPQILEIGRGILSEYHQICNGAGHPVPEGTLADDGKYNDNDSDSGDDRDDNNDSANEWDDDNNDDGRNSGDDNDDDLADDVDSNDASLVPVRSSPKHQKSKPRRRRRPPRVVLRRDSYTTAASSTSPHYLAASAR